MSAPTLATRLKRIGACPEAVAWVRGGKYATLQAAWDVCERHDWMLWLCGATNTHRDECVRLVFRFADRAVRVDAVAALRAAAGAPNMPAKHAATLHQHADTLASLLEIDSSDAAGAARYAAGAARDAAWAASDAAGAARDAAAGAARDAAAGAASAAAGAASAAARAASDAAWAARYAAWAASYAARAASDAAWAARYAAWAASYAARAASDAAGAARDAENAALIREAIPSVATIEAALAAKERKP